MTDLLCDGERITEVNFRLQLIEKTNGMKFGTDGLLLAAFVKEKKNGQAAEFGAGSGIVSMLCATREKFSHIDAYEVQPYYAELCRRNLELNGLKDRVCAVGEDIRDAAERICGKYDAVFSNPPYMKESAGYASCDTGRHAARHEVYGTVADFCRCASRMLKYGGIFYAVWRPDRLTDMICAMRENGLEPKKMTMVCADCDAPPSLCLIEAKKGAAPSAVCTPVLFLKDRNGQDTKEMAELLCTGRFPL